jgi:transposase
VVRRRDERPGPRLGRGGREKGGPREPADHALGRSRGGFGSKVHVISDARGTPITAEVTAGQVHESTAVEGVMGTARVHQGRGRPRTRPGAIAGDKAYDVPRIRQWLRGRGITPVIPEKRKPHGRKPGRPPVLDAARYRMRNAVERCVGWLKHKRRIATRYEKTARNFRSMVHLAIIQVYLRLLCPKRAPLTRLIA